MQTALLYVLILGNGILAALGLFRQGSSTTGLVIDLLTSLSLALAGFGLFKLLAQFSAKSSSYRIFRIIILGTCALAFILGTSEVIDGPYELLYENAFAVGIVGAAFIWTVKKPVP